MHDEPSDLEDVAIMPSQFADMRRSAQRSGLHMLMLAVLQDAIRIWSRAKPAALADNRATIEAGSWLFDEQDRSPFSLNWICDNLGIEGGRLRMQLQTSRPTIPLHRRGGVARGNRISPPRDRRSFGRTAGIETLS